MPARVDDARHDAARAELLGAIEALRTDTAAQMEALRRELQALTGSLHLGSLERIEAVERALETLGRPADPAPTAGAVAKGRRGDQAALERATAELQRVLLERNEALVRALEQELVRVTVQLQGRLDEIEARGDRGTSAEPRPSRASG